MEGLIHLFSEYDSQRRWRRVLTFIPPSRTDAQVFVILGFGNFSVLVTGLWDGIVCLTSTFFDQLFTDTVGYVCLCGMGCALAKFFCDGAGWLLQKGYSSTFFPRRNWGWEFCSWTRWFGFLTRLRGDFGGFGTCQMRPRSCLFLLYTSLSS